MNLPKRPAETSRFLAAQNRDEIFVLVFSTEKVPVKDCRKSIGRNQNGNQHQRQSPNLDVVPQERNNCAGDDQNNPTASGVQASGIISRVRFGQTVKLCELDFGLQRLFN